MADDLEAKARVADEDGDQRRHAECERNAEPGRQPVVVPAHHHDVGADAQKRAVAEAHQPEAPHHRPAGVHEGPEQRHDEQVQRVVAHAGERRRREQRKADPAQAIGHPTSLRAGPAAARTSCR